ncbi:uncharacterized protein LOC129960557 [Argiope bruennichi]|uniref:uncharacterized protein LOC129960557 n=1 Tax=Argiope bruennichi TaxID=94029 RepID=UPI002495540E|nr:uncharacterized protein LOC129960557 [Argiope bruennichi]
MSENGETKASKSKSFLHWEDWIVLLTGGMVTGGAIGWIVYRSFKSQQLDYKAIKTIVTSFVGGMGIYFTSSAIIFMYQKSSDSWRKSITSKKDESNWPVLDCEVSPCKRYIDAVNKLDKKLVYETSKFMECKDFGKKISRDIILEAAEEPRRSEYTMKMLNDLNQRGPKKGLLKLPTDNKVETCYKEDIGIEKAKVKEEIISCISELKGYVQGTIDPLPSARNIQLRSSEISDETYRRVVVIVKEYANSMIPKLEQVIDDFIVSVGKSGPVHSDREHKVKKASETLGVPEKDLRSTRLESPSTAGIPFKFQGVNKPEHPAVEKLKNQIWNRPEKLKLNQDQIKSLNILKSEL